MQYSEMMSLTTGLTNLQDEKPEGIKSMIPNACLIIGNTWHVMCYTPCLVQLTQLRKFPARRTMYRMS